MNRLKQCIKRSIKLYNRAKRTRIQHKTTLGTSQQLRETYESFLENLHTLKSIPFNTTTYREADLNKTTTMRGSREGGGSGGLTRDITNTESNKDSPKWVGNDRRLVHQLL